MSNGIVSISAPRRAIAVLLAVSIFWIGGCDTSAAPPVPSQTAGDPQQSQPRAHDHAHAHDDAPDEDVADELLPPTDDPSSDDHGPTDDPSSDDHGPV